MWPPCARPWHPREVIRSGRVRQARVTRSNETSGAEASFMISLTACGAETYGKTPAVLRCGMRQHRPEKGPVTASHRHAHAPLPPRHPVRQRLGSRSGRNKRLLLHGGSDGMAATRLISKRCPAPIGRSRWAARSATMRARVSARSGQGLPLRLRHDPQARRDGQDRRLRRDQPGRGRHRRAARPLRAAAGARRGPLRRAWGAGDRRGRDGVRPPGANRGRALLPSRATRSSASRTPAGTAT